MDKIKQAIEVIEGDYFKRIINSFTQVDEIKQALQTLIDFVLSTLKDREEAEQKLTKDEFHNILSEFPPSIAEDSGQPEWTQGEIDRVWDFITKQKKYIYVKDEKTKEITRLKGEIGKLKRRLNEKDI